MRALTSGNVTRPGDGMYIGPGGGLYTGSTPDSAGNVHGAVWHALQRQPTTSPHLAVFLRENGMERLAELLERHLR